jgi:hypothetical protein
MTGLAYTAGVEFSGLHVALSVPCLAAIGDGRVLHVAVAVAVEARASIEAVEV